MNGDVHHGGEKASSLNKSEASEGTRSTARRSLNRYLEIGTGTAVRSGVIEAIQTFGARINFHPHIHFLATEGGIVRPGRPDPLILILKSRFDPLRAALYFRFRP
jgi:hypothetical protein